MRPLIALSLLALSGCPWDAQGNYIGQRLPDGGIPQSAFQQINLLDEWNQYALAYGGQRSRPKPTLEQLCAFWPSTAVVSDKNEVSGAKGVGIVGATTRAWVTAVLGTPPGGVGVEGMDTVVDAYRWSPDMDGGVKQEQGGITLEYEFSALGTWCYRPNAHFGDGTPVDGRDCDEWRLKTITTQDPQPYLQCWRNADTFNTATGYQRPTPRSLWLQSQGIVPDAGM